jgi:hypothetical protein
MMDNLLFLDSEPEPAYSFHILLTGQLNHLGHDARYVIQTAYPAKF